MDKFKIYCTEKQTKKSLELGAPINTFGYGDLGDAEDKILKLNKQCVIKRDSDNSIIVSFLPTAEQMIGWLEEQKVYLEPRHTDEKKIHIWVGSFIPHPDGGWTNSYSTIKEATLAAIDLALDYLTNQKTDE